MLQSGALCLKFLRTRASAFATTTSRVRSFHSAYEPQFSTDITVGISNVATKGDMNRQITNISVANDKQDIAAGSRSYWEIAGSRSKKWGLWAEALRKVVLQPEQHGDIILQETQEAVIIQDKFPKGRKHFLIVSKQDGLDSLEDLQSSHLRLVKSMHALGETWIQSLLKEDPSLVLRLGYHSDPSMRQLHMHVISQDFDSPSLKNKKHWNSFTTSFFRDSKAVIEELERAGKVQPCGDESSLLKLELRCHRCGSVHANISRLKQHIQSCKAPFSSDLVQKGYLYMTSGKSTP